MAGAGCAGGSFVEGIEEEAAGFGPGAVADREIFGSEALVTLVLFGLAEGHRVGSWFFVGFDLPAQ